MTILFQGEGKEFSLIENSRKRVLSIFEDAYYKPYLKSMYYTLVQEGRGGGRFGEGKYWDRGLIIKVLIGFSIIVLQSITA